MVNVSCSCIYFILFSSNLKFICFFVCNPLVIAKSMFIQHFIFCHYQVSTTMLLLRYVRNGLLFLNEGITVLDLLFNVGDVKKVVAQYNELWGMKCM